MPSLSIIAVEGSAGEGASGSYSLPIYNVSPAPSLGGRSDTSISGKAFHTWSAVNFPQPTYAGVSNGYSEGGIPTGWYWINSANSGIQIKVGVSNTGFTFGPLKIAGTAIGQGSSVTGSSEKIWGLGTKSNSYGEVYYMFYSSRESIIGEGAKVYPLQFAFTFDGIADLITGDDPYGPAPGGAGAGSAPGGGGDAGQGHGFPTGTNVGVPTSKIGRAGVGADIYLCSAAAIKAFTKCLWGSTDSGFIDAFFHRVQNTVYNPIDSIITCHSLPTAFTPPAAVNTGIVAGGVDFSRYNSAAVGGIVSGEWVSWTSSSCNLAECWANYADYNHMTISLHLPFCGVVPLEPSEVVGGSVYVVYWCNVLNGNCAAFIVATDRDGDSKVVKVATGNCAQPCPISGNDRGMQQKLGAAVGFAQGMMSMGNQAVRGAVSGGTGMPTNFDLLGNYIQAGTSWALAPQHTSVVGSLNGAAGFAGSTEVFIILDYEYPVDSGNYTICRGRPSEVSGTVSSYGTGTYCELEVNPINITVATDEEKEEIRRLCASGVII